MGVPLSTKLDSTMRYDADADRYGVAPGSFYYPASIHVPPRLIGQTPDPDDDECDGTTIDPAWVAWDDASKASVTPGSPCAPWNGAASTHYWDQGIERPSCLTMQAKQSGGLVISKAITPLPNSGQRWIAYARCLQEIRTSQGTLNGTLPEGIFAISLHADNAGRPDWNNDIHWVVYPARESGSGFTIQLVFGQVVGGSDTPLWSHHIDGAAAVGPNAYGNFKEPCKFGFFHEGSSFGGFFGDEYTEVVSSSGAGGNFSLPFSIGHVAIKAFRGIATSPATHINVDYFRIRRGPASPTSGDSLPRLP